MYQELRNQMSMTVKTMEDCESEKRKAEMVLANAVVVNALTNEFPVEIAKRCCTEKLKVKLAALELELKVRLGGLIKDLVVVPAAPQSWTTPAAARDGHDGADVVARYPVFACLPPVSGFAGPLPAAAAFQLECKPLPSSKPLHLC